MNGSLPMPNSEALKAECIKFWPRTMDEEDALRLRIGACYAKPRHPLMRRLWDAVMHKVSAYICNYSNRPLDPHNFARLLEADLRALQERRKLARTQDLAAGKLVKEGG